MIHFIRPYWLMMLVPSLIFLLWTLYTKRRRNPWMKVCDAHLLPALIQTNVTPSMILFYIVLPIFYVVSVIALAGPAWQKVEVPAYRDNHSYMLVLDLSSAMRFTDLKANRLMRAKYKIRDLLSASREMQMGLVVFSGEPFIVSPVTKDGNTLNALLEELDPTIMPVDGADCSGGLSEAYRLLQQSGAPNGRIILFTGSEPSANSFVVASTIAKSGGKVDILAMMQPSANNRNIMEGLKQLATVGGGRFYTFTPDDHDIQQIADQIKQDQTSHHLQADNLEWWQDAGAWLCLLLVPTLLIVLREGKRHGY